MSRSSRKTDDLQLPLWNEEQPLGVINVASIPQRSVFRYPGGKTWLVPYIRKWLVSRNEQPAEFIEPFAGGGIVGLSVAFENLAKRVTLVELDQEVAAVWHTLLSPDAIWLAERIVAFDLSSANVEEELARPVTSTRERAFQVILKNRINRGGILASGAGRIKTGENGKGLASRWYPQTLQKRILDIVAVREKICFIEGDGIDIIRQNASAATTAFFIDPPYTAGGKQAGRRLYNCSQIDHQALFDMMGEVTGDFLMTYDNTEDVQRLARQQGFYTEAIPMKNTHHTQMTELLIGRNLEWLRSAH